MRTRLQIAAETARALRGADLGQFRAVLGFDGFVDDIVDVVGERRGAERYERMATITEFAQSVAGAAGQGCNFEWVVTRRKLGGNGPIMGNALSVLGMPLTYIGAVGDGAGGGIHGVFADLARRATVLPLCAAARTHALEFDDGKLMMGELATLSEITWERLLERVGLERLVGLCEEATVLGFLNWTMVPHATALWRKLGEEVLPRLSAGRKRRVFIDLADPKKRSREDLAAAVRVLAGINEAVPVTLGLNLAEARQVGAALGLAAAGQTAAGLAVVIRGALNLDMVVIHPTEGAAMATAGAVAGFAGPYVRQPKILTGGGDHFMAGFAAGQVLGLAAEECLCLGTAVSGYYVREGASPTVGELGEFLEHFPEARST